MKSSSVNALNLVLELKRPWQMPLLLLEVNRLRNETFAALDTLHFVHYARFLPTRDSQYLLVITEYDGDLEPYALDFAAAISKVFNAILAFVKDAEHLLPVQDHPERFYEFVKKNNRVTLDHLPDVLPDPWPLYSAYGDRTVIEIQGPRVGLPPPFPVPHSTPIDYADVQGNILRGYRADLAMHFSVEVKDHSAAKRLLGELVSGHAPNGLNVTNATDWGKNRPPFALNVGLTAAGLAALRVPKDIIGSFPRVFREGPADKVRAENNGDVGDSAPRHWRLGPPGEAVHLLFSLYDFNNQPDAFPRAVKHLEAQLALHGMSILGRYPAFRIPNDAVYFDYRDSIAQPHIKDVPTDAGDDMQPEAEIGDFLLGAHYRNVYGGKSLGELPTTIGTNGTFCAVRLLEQDVSGFELFLDRESKRLSIDKELLAAKLMGRWRNGDPLRDEVVRGPTSVHTFATSDLNKFDFAPTVEHPGTPDDHAGRICPVGAHIRRMNPRSGLVVGKQYGHRVIRRGMPYAETVPVDSTAGGQPDGLQKRHERGLFGMFIGSDLERQFEFLMQTWANRDTSALGLRGTQDPIIGDQSKGGALRIPRPQVPCPPPCAPADVTLEARLSRFVRTRGSVYLFMPGLAAIRNIATMGHVDADVVGLSHVEWDDLSEPDEAAPAYIRSSNPFDPRDPHFLANPYPFFQRLRDESPVLWVEKYRSFWVFTHELVTQVCEDKAQYTKTKPGTRAKQGLFFMDPPRHDAVRPTLDTRFAQSILGVEVAVEKLVERAIDRLIAEREFDWVASFAAVVPRSTFMEMFGVPEWDRGKVGRWVDLTLDGHDPYSGARRGPATMAAIALTFYMSGMLQHCPATGGRGFACTMSSDDIPAAHRMDADEAMKSAVHFALGGYLSTQFLVTTGMLNLLSGALRPFDLLRARPELVENAIAEMRRFDAPFQMADRFAQHDAKLGVVDIPAGSMVTVVYGSANRDERVFCNPEVFDITRSARELTSEYAFGHGIHRCIGEPLVDLVAPIVFRRVVERLPGLHLDAGGPSWLKDPYFRSCARLRLKT